MKSRASNAGAKAENNIRQNSCHVTFFLDNANWYTHTTPKGKWRQNIETNIQHMHLRGTRTRTLTARAVLEYCRKWCSPFSSCSPHWNTSPGTPFLYCSVAAFRKSHAAAQPDFHHAHQPTLQHQVWANLHSIYLLYKAGWLNSLGDRIYRNT